MNINFHPVTPSRWDDLAALFGPHGATGGCWCMYWRLTRREFEHTKGEGNKRALKSIVDSGQVPGILAYDRDRPIAWCSVAPREDYPSLDRSRVSGRVDDQPVWSIVCFFVAKEYRRKGVTVRLLQSAVEYARCQGAKIVEGYPVEPKKGSTADVFAYTGLVSAFRKAGFVEVARRSETRPLMRFFIEEMQP